MKTYILAFTVILSLLDFSLQAIKPGFCPSPKPCKGSATSASCAVDENCEGNKKCCVVGCETKCLKPKDTPPEAVQAPSRAVPSDGSHIGYCPIRKIPKNCAQREFSVTCMEDNHCQLNEKCCQMGCDFRCQKALLEIPELSIIPTIGPSSSNNPGFCPLDNGCNNGQFTATCNGDHNCPSGKKCCSVKCKRECVKALETEPVAKTTGIPMKIFTIEKTGGSDKTQVVGTVKEEAVGDRTTTPVPTTSEPSTAPETTEAPAPAPTQSTTKKPRNRKTTTTPVTTPETTEEGGGNKGKGRRNRNRKTTTPTQQTTISSTESTSTSSPTRPLPPLPVRDLPSATGEYRYAGVSTDSNPCADIGVEILAKHRGSAVDAAIATMLCNGVVGFGSSGIGGGCVMTIYDTPKEGPKKKIMNTIIARERAPLKAKQDMFVDDPVGSKVGGKAIAVPGEIKGFHEAWLKFGRVPWKTLFQPAIKLANKGFFVTRWIEFAANFTDAEGLLRNNQELSKLLIKEDGTIVKEGDIIKMPKYGATLEKIANDPKAFYHMKSQLAKDIIADINDHDGIMSQRDLHLYKVYDKDPISVHLQNGDKTLYGPRPPISGAVIAFMLNILDEYGMKPDDFSSKQKKGLALHRIIEAFKFAFAKRSALGDEEFVDGLEELLNNMTSDDYAKNIRNLINDDQTQDVEFYGPSFNLRQDAGTSHTAVLAPDGSAVSATSTINLLFGSKVVGKRTGIIFNNEMDDFSTPGQINFFGVAASPSNFIAPRKMPMSSMSPIIVLDKGGDVSFISGASGGTRITTSTALVTALSLWLGLNATEAVDFPRIHHQLLPNEARISSRLSNNMRKELEKRGHKLVVQSIASTVQAIHKRCSNSIPDYISGYDNVCIDVASDSVKQGIPDGY